MSDLIVQVQQGKVKGKVCSTENNTQFYSFKGIPYAKPPVGNLRFSVPQPPDSWEGIRDSTECNICAQIDRVTSTFIGDEDCLYLNVYTPKLPNGDTVSLPVMVYFHGGGFVYGSGTDESVHGPNFLVEKNIVLVTLNYRLGVLGFLSLNSSEAPGNMGLRDQVQALKWVQANISSFGGCPNNVTIFGISAGGASVEYLLLSPMAKGLFHKAIAQSGSSLLPWAHNSNVKELAFTIPALRGDTVSKDEQLLQYLKEMTTEDLIASSLKALASDKFRGGIHFGFVPTVEKPGDWELFLDKSPYDLLVQGKFTKVPVMTGFCSREGLLMIASGQVILNKLVKEKDFIQHLPFNLDETQADEVNNKMKSIYLDEGINTNNESDDFAINFFTDVDILGGIYVATSLMAKNNSPTYFYEFAYDGKLNYLKRKCNINRKGACHGDDGGYIIKSNLVPQTIPKIDKLVSDRMVTMWTNFAKHGNPTPTTNELLTTKWEAVTSSGMRCLHIDDELTMKYEIYPERMKLFEELYAKHYNSTYGLTN